MNVEIGVEAALFPEKDYTNGIAVAEYGTVYVDVTLPVNRRRGLKDTHPR
jgi:hypothetical protein